MRIVEQYIFIVGKQIGWRLKAKSVVDQTNFAVDTGEELWPDDPNRAMEMISTLSQLLSLTCSCLVAKQSRGLYLCIP